MMTCVMDQTDCNDAFRGGKRREGPHSVIFSSTGLKYDHV